MAHGRIQRQLATLFPGNGESSGVRRQPTLTRPSNPPPPPNGKRIAILSEPMAVLHDRGTSEVRWISMSHRLCRRAIGDFATKFKLSHAPQSGAFESWIAVERGVGTSCIHAYANLLSRDRLADLGMYTGRGGEFHGRRWGGATRDCHTSSSPRPEKSII